MKVPPSFTEDGAPASRGDPDASRNATGDADDSPGVPVFRTWGGVYAFVFGCFVLMVILLALFSRAYR